MSRLTLLVSLAIWLGFPMASAQEREALDIVLKAVLPPKVKTLLDKRPDKDETLKVLGKPDLVEDASIYYAMDGYKYSLSVTFKDKKIARYRYRFSKETYTLEDFAKALDFKQLKMPKADEHEGGRYLTLLDKKSGLLFTFLNNDKKNLYSIEYDAPPAK